MRLVSLSEICELIAGQSPPSEYYNYDGVGLPFYQGKTDFGEKHPSIRVWCSKPTKISDPNDILFSVRAPVGATNINDKKACIGRGICAIRCGGNVSMNYLLFFLRSAEKIIADSGSGSTFKAITIKQLRELKIPLPPLHIQERIAEILGAAEALRQKDRQLLEKYEQLSQSIFLDMFGDPMSNLNKFKTYRVSEVCEKILGGGTPSKSNKSFYIGEIPWVTPKDMKVEDIINSIDKVNIDAVENSSAKLIPANSILMVIRSGILKKKLPVAINRVEVTVNQDMKAFIPNSNLITNEYLLNVFKASEPYLLGKVRAVTADNIEFKQIKDLKIPVPDLDLQEKFSKSIGKVKKQKSLLNHNIQKSESLFQSLLQKAFKGELVPEDQLKPA